METLEAAITEWDVGIETMIYAMIGRNRSVKGYPRGHRG